jgi:hypothetical protein
MATPRKPLPDVCEFSHRDWRFRWRSGCPIAGASALEALSASLQLGNIPLPEMTYADNFLEVEHPSHNFSLRFSALGALRNWHAMQRATAQPPGSSVDVTNCDWAFTTAYDGEASRSAGGAGSAGAAAGAPSGAPHLDAFSPGCARELPVGLLSEKRPILAFAEVPLFASDLNDRGCAELDVKLRVTEDYAFLRCTAFTRLDGCLARARDVRFFVDLSALGGGAARVLRDVQVRVGAVARVVALAAAADDAPALPVALPSFMRRPFCASPGGPPAPEAAPAAGVGGGGGENAPMAFSAAAIYPAALISEPPAPPQPESPRLLLKASSGADKATEWPARPPPLPSPPLPSGGLPSGRLAITVEDMHAALAPALHQTFELQL